MTTRGRPLRAVIASLVSVVVLVVSGCTPPAPDASQDLDLRRSLSRDVSAAQRDYYTQDVQLRPCGDDAECTTMRVPTDWNRPESGDASISVARHRASGESSGSLVMNPGGPGAGAVDYVRRADYRRFLFGEELERSFDLVTFDPRGVGESQPIRCTDDAGLDRFLYDLPRHERGTEAYVRDARDSMHAFGRGCLERSDGLAAHVSTDDVVRDLDVLRGVLGQRRLDYLGFSYGTKIGALYANAHPDRVGRFVLDGAVDPSLTGAEMIVGQQKGFDGAARAWLSDCLSKEGCPFSGPVDAAARQLTALIERVDRSPQRAQDGRRLGSATLITAISQALYAPQLWPDLTEAIRQVERGDPSAAFALADSYNERQGDGSYASNSTEAFLSVSCLDAPHADDEASRAELQRQIRSASGIMGRFAADGTVECEGWPVPATGRPHRVSAKGAGPIMVIGTTGDPATPFAWSRSLAEQLESGFLVTNVADGHTAYNAEASACIREAVLGYLATGERPEQTRCRG